MNLTEIPGFEGYFADPDGHVYSNRRGELRQLAECQQKNRGKKLYTRMKLAGAAHLAHRVIAGIHVGRRLHVGEVVNHIDGNTRNNSLSNLEVTSHHGNVAHAVQNKLYCSGPAWYAARGLEMPGTARTFND